MKILRCEIENFGKLSGVQFDFSDGLNKICLENGAGKSTLAAFIRIMLYGFENDRARDTISNERKRFRPWQGGVYGGRLCFENAGKGYCINRTFGGKESEDTFELRDLSTNLISSDYSSNTGFDLFKIDAESFRRTMFISQNDCSTKTTDKINAKLGNISELTGDIDNYDKAWNKLNDLINGMSPNRKTGSLAKEKDRISELSVRLGTYDGVDESTSGILKLLKETKSEKEKLTEKYGELSERRKTLSRHMDLEAKADRLSFLEDELAKRRRECEGCRSFFPLDIPDEQRVKSCMEDCENLGYREAEAGHLALGGEEEQRYNGYLKREDICGYDRSGELENNILNLRRERDKLTFSDEEKALLDDYRLNGSVTLKKKVGKPVKVVLSLLSVVSFTICIVLLAMKSELSGILFFLPLSAALMCGLGCMVAGTFILVSEHKKKENLKERISELVNRCRTVEKITAEEKTASMEYENYVREKKDFGVLSLKKEAYIEADKALCNVKNRLTAFLTDYGFGDFPDENCASVFRDIKDRYDLYRNSEREYHRAKDNLLSFMSQMEEIGVKIDELRRILSDRIGKSSDELERLSDEMNNTVDKMNAAGQSIVTYERQLDDLNNKMSEAENLERELNVLKSDYESGYHKYELLCHTKKLLEEAKNSFTARYMEPIMNGFKKYYSVITGDDATEYMLDASMKLSVKEWGMFHDTELLSAGCKDLVGVALRMALVDAMYKDEKPFLLFDDPFVNLDDNNLYGGMKLILELARKHQIIYFTCRKS